MQTSDYRSSHLYKGDDYHDIFEDDPYTSMMWRLERQALDVATLQKARDK